MGVVDGVHGDAAHGRPLTQPALASGLAELDVLLVGVGYCADGGHAFGPHHAQLPGVEAQLGIALVLADDLCIGAGGAGDLSALADLHLDVVDDGTDGNVLHRHGIARFDVHGIAGNDLVAFAQPLRRQDVAEIAVCVLDQGDEGGPVGIVFKAQHRRLDIVLQAFEIDDPVPAFVAAAPAPRGDAAVIIAPAFVAKSFGQGFFRFALPKLGPIDEHEAAAAGGGGVVCF